MPSELSNFGAPHQAFFEEMVAHDSDITLYNTSHT